jgi:hypothetical protein
VLAGTERCAPLELLMNVDVQHHCRSHLHGLNNVWTAKLGAECIQSLTSHVASYSAPQAMCMLFRAAGKTMVYALPLICIALQDEMALPLEGGEGPLGLIICPSRELANQTVEVITQFTEAIKTVSLSPRDDVGTNLGPLALCL